MHLAELNIARLKYLDEGHEPTLAEAKARLDHLDQRGDSDFAFGWSHLPHVKLWQQARCA